jgi:hypothetical protein
VDISKLPVPSSRTPLMPARAGEMSADAVPDKSRSGAGPRLANANRAYANRTNMDQVKTSRRHTQSG